MSLLQIWDVTAEYSRFEAWAYDAFTAPALTEWIAGNLLDELLESVPENARVLDVGCGGGQLPLAIKDRRGDLETHALDLSGDQVQWARHRAGQRNRTIHLTRANAMNLPYPAESFDLVVSVGSIKHWPDQRRGLEECLRVLTDSGNLHVLEADPEVDWGNALTFVSNLNFPTFLQLPFLPYFKYVVAGNGPTQTETRELFSGTNATDSTTRSLTDVPLVHTKATP